jgi:hypothetical protein
LYNGELTIEIEGLGQVFIYPIVFVLKNAKGVCFSHYVLSALSMLLGKPILILNSSDIEIQIINFSAEKKLLKVKIKNLKDFLSES